MKSVQDRRSRRGVPVSGNVALDLMVGHHDNFVRRLQSRTVGGQQRYGCERGNQHRAAVPNAEHP